LILFVILISIVSYGQHAEEGSQKEIFNNRYGLDVLLHQGKLYYPDINVANGHPFFGDDGVTVGDIVIEGKKYVDQKLKYNIYLQEIILVFNDLIGAEKQIVIDNDKIDTVYYGKQVFIKNQYPKIGKAFVQLVSNNAIPCYIAWGKNKEISSTVGVRGYSYSNEKKAYYLFYHSNLYQFRNNKSFMSIFPEDQQKLIKAYLKANKYKIGKINPEQLKQLIDFVERGTH
jgi:hypothetical protein